MIQRTLRVALLPLMLIAHYRIHAQTAFTSGYYEISAGLYAECCGIGGEFGYQLPDENQQFAELIIDPGGTSARLTFLQPDMFTVFTAYSVIYPQTVAFPFTFSNGIVFSNYIRFVFGGPFPVAPQASWSYTVINVGGKLGISGTVVTARYGADVPNQFEHSNVVASLVPNPTVIDHVAHDGNAIQFHFSGRAPYDYTVEVSDSLIEADWQSLATYRAKLQTIDVAVTHPLTNAQTRFFRIRQQPCGCR